MFKIASKVKISFIYTAFFVIVWNYMAYVVGGRSSIDIYDCCNFKIYVEKDERDVFLLYLFCLLPRCSIIIESDFVL